MTSNHHINQCDGCRRKLPKVGTVHEEANGKPYMICTADRYGKKEDYFCPHCGHKGVADEGAGAVAGLCWDSEDPRSQDRSWDSRDGSLYRCLNPACGRYIIVID